PALAAAGPTPRWRRRAGSPRSDALAALQQRAHGPETEADARFQGAHRQPQPRRGLLVGEAAEVGELDGAALIGRDLLQRLAQGEQQIAPLLGPRRQLLEVDD